MALPPTWAPHAELITLSFCHLQTAAMSCRANFQSGLASLCAPSGLTSGLSLEIAGQVGAVVKSGPTGPTALFQIPASPLTSCVTWGT